MKKFTEPVMEIIRLESTDIMATSSELIGWAGLDEIDSLLDGFDTGDKLSD